MFYKQNQNCKRKFGYRKSKAIKSLGVALIGMTFMTSTLSSAEESTSSVVSKSGVPVVVDNLVMSVRKLTDPVPKVDESKINVPENKVLIGAEYQQTKIDNSKLKDLLDDIKKSSIKLHEDDALVFESKHLAEEDVNSQIEKLQTLLKAINESTSTLDELVKEADKSGVRIDNSDKLELSEVELLEEHVESVKSKLEEAVKIQNRIVNELDKSKKEAKSIGLVLKDSNKQIYDDLKAADFDINHQLEMLKTSSEMLSRLSSEYQKVVDTFKNSGIKVVKNDKKSTIHVDEVESKLTELNTDLSKSLSLNTGMLDDIAKLKELSNSSNTVVDETKKVEVDESEVETFISRLKDKVTSVVNHNNELRDDYQKQLEDVTSKNEAKHVKNEEITLSNESLKDKYDKDTAQYEIDHSNWLKRKEDTKLANEKAIEDVKNQNAEIDAENKRINDKFESDTVKWNEEKAEFEKSEERKYQDRLVEIAEAKRQNSQIDSDFENELSRYNTKKSEFLEKEQEKVEARKAEIKRITDDNAKVESDFSKATEVYNRAKENRTVTNQVEIDRVTRENAEKQARNDKKKADYEKALADYQENPGGGVASDPTNGKPVIFEKDGVKVVGEFNPTPRGNYDNYKGIITVVQEGAAKILKAPLDTSLFTGGRKMRLNENESHTTPVVGETTDGTPIKVKITNKTRNPGADEEMIGNNDQFEINGTAFTYDIEFLDGNTNQPVSIITSFIMDDIDNIQEFTFQFNDKILGIVSPTEHTDVVATLVNDTTGTLRGQSQDNIDGVNSSPKGTALIVGKGSKFTYSTPNINNLAIFAKAGAGEVKMAPKKKAPVEPTYEKLDKVPKPVLSDMPDKPVKGQINEVPEEYVAKTFKDLEPVKADYVEVKDQYVKQSFTKDKPQLDGEIRERVSDPTPIEFTEIEPVKPIEPEYGEIDKSPDLTVDEPEYRTVEIPHVTIVKYLDEYQLEVDVHDVSTTVEVNEFDVTTSIHDSYYDELDVVLADKESKVVEIKKEEPKNEEPKKETKHQSKILPATGEAVTGLAAIGASLVGLSAYIFNKNRKK